MASAVKSAARSGAIVSLTTLGAGGKTIVSANSASRGGGTIVSANSAPRGATIVSLTALGARRKDYRRRGAIVSRAGSPARLKDHMRHRMMSGRRRPGRAGGDSKQIQPAARERNDNYEEDDAEDGYKSPPGSPPRDPLTMKWQ